MFWLLQIYKYFFNTKLFSTKKSTAMPWIFSCCCLRRYLTKTFSTWLPTLTM